MAELLNQLQIWISQVIQTLGYPGIIFLMVLESVFPPIPSEVVLPMSGFLIAQGSLNLWLTILFSTLGAVLGALVIYYAAAWADSHVVRSFVQKYGRWFGVDESGLDRALGWFHRAGGWMVLLGRLAPGIRSLVSVPAGLDHMRLPTFILLTAAGSLAWNSVLIYAGLRLGENWTRILGWVERYEDGILVILAGLLVFLLVRWLLNRRKDKNAAVE